MNVLTEMPERRVNDPGRDTGNEVPMLDHPTRPGSRGPIPLSLQQRLDRKLDKVSQAPCWVWTGPCLKKGHGQMMVGSAADGTRRHRLTHVVAYELAFGPLTPEKPIVMHVCDNPPCCNPEHLRAGTIADNNRDMAEKKRSARGERNHRAKLTQSEVDTIRQSKESATILAPVYNVSRKTIARIQQGKTWT